MILTLWSLNDNVYHIHASISCAIIWLHEATVSRGLLSRHSLVSTPGPCFSVCVLWPCRNDKSEKTCIVMLFLSNSYITPTRDVSGLNCDAWGQSGLNWIQAAYKCFVSPVAKQMTWCLCVLLASQLKLSLAAVAGSVVLLTLALFAGLCTFVTVVQNNIAVYSKYCCVANGVGRTWNRSSAYDNYNSKLELKQTRSRNSG